jgi:uncharacterized protein YndB with AHSA1/START domain
MPAEKSSAARAASDRHEFTITRVFDAPRSLVFDAFTKPDHVVQWWGRKELTNKVTEMDPRAGGVFRICMTAPNGHEWWVRGVYQEVVAPSRIVFVYGLEKQTPNHESLATLTFDDERGKTKFTLQQRLLDPAQARDGAAGGWEDAMERLTAFLAQTVAR